MPRGGARKVKCYHYTCSNDKCRARFVLRKKMPRASTVCKPCQRRCIRDQAQARAREKRTEARRYRIICHVLGYDPMRFDEMIAEMKKSPMMYRDEPEGHDASLDAHWEQAVGLKASLKS